MPNITEKINSQHILAGISLNNRHYLTKIDVFKTISSTNTYLLQQINEHTPSGWVCLAEQQTAGRGRHGKNWYSPAGSNIYCSLFWRFNSVVNVSGLSIVIAVILAKMLRDTQGVSAIQLKWPNDLWVAEKKLGGILLETNAPLQVVIGIGLNLSLPAEKKLPDIMQATSLAEITGQIIKRNDLVALLLDNLLQQLPLFETQGLIPFIKAWTEFDALKDKEIKVYTPKMAVTGWMRGINARGELILEDETGELRYFCYGEVSVRC